MFTPALLSAKFAAAAPYDAYVASGTPEQRDKWASAQSRITLTAAQRALLGAFTRPVNILTLSGIWCGDCSAQCPMLAAIAAANPALIDARFLDRDQNLDLAEEVRICGGLRVPTVLFLSEEFDLVSYLGDKTLSRLRATAVRKLGPACELPGAAAPADEVGATLQDWVSEVERVHLLVRLSTKLRAKHGD
jgi:thiol-disulfide isomerase/thioredoxin